MEKIQSKKKELTIKKPQKKSQTPRKRKQQRQPRNQPRSKRQKRSGRYNGSQPMRMPVGNGQTGFGNAANRRRIVVCDKEYIGEIAVANQPNFNLSLNLPINPGQAATFPWLSTIAAQYEKYRFRKLAFEFRPEVTQFTANTNTGKIVLSCDYDASDAPPTTKQQMLDTVPHSDGMPYEYCKLVLNPSELHQNSDAKFVRIKGLPGSSDIKTYDGGNFYLATQGQTANSVVGELHVMYEVELSVPILENNAGAPTNNSVTFLYDSAASLTTATAYQPLFASASSTSVPVTNGCNVVNTAGSIVPPAGNYLVNTVTNFSNTNDSITLASVKVIYNGVTQLPFTTSNYTAAYGGSNTNVDLTLNTSQYISCNGVNAITLSLLAGFTAGTCNASTSLVLVVI